MSTINILVINAHPDKESFNQRISTHYVQTALAAGAQVRYMPLRELNFNPNLQFGYRKRTELEPDLLQALDNIRWSDHIVWVHPLWWYSYPALMKGFIDRLFLPEIAFRTGSDGSYAKLFTGRSARIITTADTAPQDYEVIFKNTALVQLKTGTLEFVGIAPVLSTYISPVYNSTEEQKLEWLRQVAQLAIEDVLSGETKSIAV
jgi:putative NADPH-quinone reductase